MAFDIYGHLSVFVKYSDFAAKLPLTTDSILSAKKDLLADLEFCEPEEEAAQNAIALLQKVESGSAFRAWLVALEDSGLTPVDEEGNFIHQALNAACAACSIRVPDFQIEWFYPGDGCGGFESVFSGILQVPEKDDKTFYLVFPFEDCFERSLTPFGKSLETMLGEKVNGCRYGSVD